MSANYHVTFTTSKGTEYVEEVRASGYDQAVFLATLLMVGAVSEIAGDTDLAMTLLVHNITDGGGIGVHCREVSFDPQD